MAKDIIVFEGRTEVIIATAANVNAIIREWFLNGDRNLDEYNVYLADGSKGFDIRVSIDADSASLVSYDVTELMPNHLREALVDAKLKVDRSRKRATV